MGNTLLQDVEYKTDQTPLGTWRRYGYENGTSYQEFRSHARVWGLPMIHITIGRSPETGRRVMAKGVVAIGRMALGLVAIGQLALGLVAVGQLAPAVLLGVGQCATGVVAVGQGAAGIAFGFGQGAIGHVAIGQAAYGHYAIGQGAWGDHVIRSGHADPAAVEFFDDWPVIGRFVSPSLADDAGGGLMRSSGGNGDQPAGVGDDVSAKPGA